MPASGDHTPLSLTVNGRPVHLTADGRATLVDVLRDGAGLTGTKKGCDRGECGACTVLVDDRRVLSCMTLARAAEGKRITTVEGLAPQGQMHPVQLAFLDKDAFQCGFCTPGQVMSAVALIAEGRANTAEEIKEWMSGNICRCAAYPQIVEAITEAAAQPGAGVPGTVAHGTVAHGSVAYGTVVPGTVAPGHGGTGSTSR
ncbi:(2Fe-2S)-binding protein [Streptomyces sp. MST-110588]|uniref:(2Fe-2S)-binding protein n=1 Tax=Streptomyces sp. MST-110588 TaxID=2833628 RepID=UPI00205923C5|nr:(2Fe-2S)-binding protein [Streptomyces sp. MST-110588]